MAVVRNTLSPVPHGRLVSVRLVAPTGWRDNGDVESTGSWSTEVDENGEWSLDLPAQSSYVVSGTWYKVSEPSASHAIVVPDGAGPHDLYDLLVDPIPTSSGWEVTPRMAQLRDATGLAAATDGQVPTWDATADEWVPGSGGGGGGVTDHGALTGLADDDHPQYQLRSEEGAAAGYAGLDGSAKVPLSQLPTGSTSTTVPLGDHTHDARYYTETEVNTALTGKQDADADLSAIAALAPADDAMMQRKAGTWTARSPLQVKADLALASSDVGLGNVTNNAQVPLSVVDAKGDLLVATAADTVTRLPVGVNGQVLTADQSESGGIRWASLGDSIYPLSGYGFHSATCAGESATVQSTFGSWHLRVWVPAGNPIATAGMVVTVAGTVGAGGLNAVAIYSDDGQILLGQTVDDDNFWASTGLRTVAMQAAIPAAIGRFVRVIVNIDGYSSVPNVAYAVPADTAGATINGTGSLQRRSAFRSAYVGSFPATVDPNSLGTPTNFLPFVVLG